MENYVICPHCNCFAQIDKINCGIFRHGIFKHNNKQIPPHLKKANCEELIKNNMIIGCGKPFMVKVINKTLIALECDYI